MINADGGRRYLDFEPFKGWFAVFCFTGQGRIPEVVVVYRLVHGLTLGVRFPKAKLNTPSTAAELVEHHRGLAPVHGVVPKEPADRIERAIGVVDTDILNLDRQIDPCAWSALRRRRKNSATNRFLCCFLVS